MVVSAVGVFHTPRYPDWPGLDEFGGTKFHTRHWDRARPRQRHGRDRGDGRNCRADGSQVAAVAKKVYVFQREPGWVIPRNDREWTAEERAHAARPYVQRLKRIQMYVRFERLIFGMRRIRDRKTSVQITAETYIDERFRDRDDLRAAVTPTYPFGGKRPLFDGRFYEALTRDNVELVPRAVKEVTRDGIVADDGVERKIDTLIMPPGTESRSISSPSR